MDVKGREEGFILVVVALVIIVLIAFVGLGVDTGVLYSARTQAQAAADAAALAGAFTFVTRPTSAQPATAQAFARSIAKEYSIFGTPILDADIDVIMSGADVAARRVPVVIRARQQTFFAKGIGLRSAAIRVESLAEAGSKPTEATNPKPFFLPNTILSTKDPCDACTSNETLLDPATGNVTAWAAALLAATPGPRLSVKPQDPKDALEPSMFFLIDFTGGGGGGSELQDSISGEVPAPPAACGKLLDAEKGDKTGPMFSGVNGLLGSPPDDTYEGIGQYRINGSMTSDTSKALVSIPIWDICGVGYCPSKNFPGTGISKIKVIGFAVMFLEGMASKHDPLIGRLISIGGCGATPGPGGSTVVGGFPLRLVRSH